MRRSRSHNGPRGRRAEDDERAASSLPGRTCIPTDLLRTFVAISEVGSFTKAGHLFGLTQPAVTSHMRRLKSLVGADLLRLKSPIAAMRSSFRSGALGQPAAGPPPAEQPGSGCRVAFGVDRSAPGRKKQTRNARPEHFC